MNTSDSFDVICCGKELLSPESTKIVLVQDVEELRGVVERDLRPVGKARIAGSLCDVVSQGDYIEVGESVRVIAVEGARVVVSDSGGLQREA